MRLTVAIVVVTIFFLKKKKKTEKAFHKYKPEGKMNHGTHCDTAREQKKRFARFVCVNVYSRCEVTERMVFFFFFDL
jgi:predicted PurR-regulated permease PerM